KCGRLLRDRVAIAKYLTTNEDLALEDYQWRNSVSCPSSYIAELDHMAFISSTNNLLSNDGKLLNDELADGITEFNTRSKLWDMEIDKDRFITKMPVHQFDQHIFDAGIYLMIDHDKNYFHWVVEILPAIYLYEKMMSERKLPLLISNG